MVPEGWGKTTVGDALVKVVNPVKVDPKRLYQQVGIRSHGKGLFDKAHVTGLELGDKRVFWIEPECFVVNIVFAWEQAIARTTAADVGKIASHRFPMYRSKGSACDTRYIEYFFKTPRGKYLLGIASPGGAGRNKTLGQKEFDRVPLTLPPLPEQRKIADILSTWDAAIEKTEALLATAKAQKRALMQSLLTGKRRFPEFEGQPWKEMRLGSLGKCIRGVSYKPDQILDSETHETFRLYRSMNIQGGEIVEEPYVIVPRSVVTDERVLIPGDLAVCMSNGSKLLVGKSAPIRHTTGRYTVGAFCAIFRTHEADLQDFVRVLFQSPQFERHITVALAGSSINNLKNSDIEGMRFVVPSSHTEMIKIASVMNSANTEIVALLDQITKRRTEKKALMQQLLTGKRRVSV